MTTSVKKPPLIRPSVRHPLYTFAEAARALDVPPSTFATWPRICPSTTRSQGRDRRSNRDVLSNRTSRARRSFVGLAEGMVLAAVRSSGVSLQRVRPALEELAHEIGIAHALASKALYTDGAELLFDYAQHGSGEAAEAANELTVIRSVSAYSAT